MDAGQTRERLTVDAALRVARFSYSLETTLEATEVLADEVERLRAAIRGVLSQMETGEITEVGIEYALQDALDAVSTEEDR
jgi:hypothetical protein